MPGPPPPPPPSAPPPPVFTPPKGGGGGGGPDDRSALLKSIRTGTKLKKTVTNDKSAPIIPGKISNGGGGGGGGGNSSTSSLSTSGVANGMNLGGLFAGGMPKLRATGKLGASSLSNSTNNINNNNNSINNDNRKKPDVPPQQPVKSFNSVQNELKKQMASDNRNRGPPPPAPVRNISEENGLKPSTPTKPQQQSTVVNGYRSNQSALHGNLQINNSALHRKAISNANLTSLDNTDSVNGFGPSMTATTKPVINHGKPNLAPKPPTLNGKPIAPPKKLLINGKPVSRAHSMKSPRTPSPSSTTFSLQQSPDNAAIKFGTVRNLSSVIGQSLGHSTGNLSPRQRPMLNGRPTAPPPSVPNHVPPPPPPLHSPSSNLNPQQSYKTSNNNNNNNSSNVRPPNHAPPPPPPNIVLPQPPNHAPPLPPHRTQPTRPPPAKENYSSQVPAHTNTAPPPPPRQSSMRDNSLNNQNNNNNIVRKQAVDFDEKFKHMFHKTNMFPKPPPYRHVIKLYSNRQAISKQQAPQPPNLQTIQSRWDHTSAC